MKVRFNVIGYVDRRSASLRQAAQAMEQSRADATIEQIWRERVARNLKEQRRLRRGETFAPIAEIPAMLRHQAD